MLKCAFTQALKCESNHVDETHFYIVQKFPDLFHNFLFSLFLSDEVHHIFKRDTADDKLKIVGFRVEHAEKEPSIEEGVPVLRAGTKVMLRLFGMGFNSNTTIGLTAEQLEFGGTCNMMISTGFFKIIRESSTNARVEVLLPKNTVELFFCASNDEGVSSSHNSVPRDTRFNSKFLFSRSADFSSSRK